MPEGDTIWRTARALHDALAGRTVTELRSSVPSVAAAARRLRIVGRTVEAVEARGKHLLLRFAGGAVLHTHQGMNGSWRVRPAGGRPWSASHRVRVVLETKERVAVCIGSPVVELLSAGAERLHPALAGLGPDVLADAFDPSAARLRLRARAETEIGPALMDQRALSGIGNVYKSEVLFLCGVSPFARVGDLDDPTLDRLIETAAAQMKRNLGRGPRRTTPERSFSSHWVYRRAGIPCRRCGAAIQRRVQGQPPRSTYFCPACQPGPSPSKPTGPGGRL
jgi:endonuclease VIII